MTDDPHSNKPPNRAWSQILETLRHKKRWLMERYYLNMINGHLGKAKSLPVSQSIFDEHDISRDLRIFIYSLPTWHLGISQSKAYLYTPAKTNSSPLKMGWFPKGISLFQDSIIFRFHVSFLAMYPKMFSPYFETRDTFKTKHHLGYLC